MVQKGDKVAVVDDDISGIVISTEDDIIVIEDQNGFEMRFHRSEVVQILNEDLLYQTPENMQQILEEKERPKKRTLIRDTKKERQHPPMEVDLHIDKLIKHYKELSNYEILDIQLETAKRQLAFAIRKRIQRVIFIHGVGAGVLKSELEYHFQKYDGIKITDGDYKKYGLGAMEIYIPQYVTELEY